MHSGKFYLLVFISLSPKLAHTLITAAEELNWPGQDQVLHKPTAVADRVRAVDPQTKRIHRNRFQTTQTNRRRHLLLDEYFNSVLVHDSATRWQLSEFYTASSVCLWSHVFGVFVKPEDRVKVPKVVSPS